MLRRSRRRLASPVAGRPGSLGAGSPMVARVIEAMLKFQVWDEPRSIVT